MNVNSALFQLNKAKRLILTLGTQFTFTRPSLNQFNEPNGTTESIELRGVYHETASYLSKVSAESSTIRQKPMPMILALWEDAKILRHTDRLSYNGSEYKIGEIRNIAEANVVADISLEEVQHEL